MIALSVVEGEGRWHTKAGRVYIETAPPEEADPA